MRCAEHYRGFPDARIPYCTLYDSEMGIKCVTADVMRPDAIRHVHHRNGKARAILAPRALFIHRASYRSRR
ncbi:hypothetical protein KCP75_02810 [Salmonella enterica subsp. enterica]|nr:hypothetical protein KCP75_02810 [Salmonella enterica subsp. enterica]